MKKWHFENYTVYEEMDVLRFEDVNGSIIGYVSFDHENKDQLISELDAGVDPIEDGWEDGIGNTINLNGWGNE